METALKIILSNFLKIFSKLSPSFTAKIAWSLFCKPRIKKKPLSKFETQLLQSSRQYFINSGEYRISVYEWENEKNLTKAKTILLTHGWGGHALNFSRIITALTENGFNVVAHDSPAHGKSSGNQTNLLHNTKALLAVAEHVGAVHILIGHSFGAMANSYALDLCNSSTERSTTHLENVEKLVLIAGPNRLTDIFASFAQAMQLPENILNIFFQKLEVIAKRKIETMTVSNFLHSHNGKTLVIHDRKDPVVPFSEAESITNALAAELFATTDNGHSRILKAKEVIEKIVDFLN